ncbi:MAG: UDP-N-acetylmuramoyl-L-alanyl-D-glutamate--2,6-diaminopimelate ligase [Halomonadaceae bacterium]|nr:MAG: UDP-N-acetylmuramoyl-L-alanyl-D-glutamate--2,6-diaminopimelate ligase [Halomonadaceae bacterium]
MERINSLISLLRETVTVPSVLDVRIHGLSSDSRELRSGDAFIAVAGTSGDAWDHVPEAVARGAAAVLLDVASPAACYEWQGALIVPVPDLKRWQAALADRFYDSPSQSLSVVGVTGTNGKTSVTRFLTQLLNGAGVTTASIGTLGYGFPGQETPASHTTPGPVRLQRLLAGYRRAGAQAVVMEVSSHALVQGRVDWVDFTGAVLTNLSQDHLDYHGTLEAYGQAKAALFTRLEPAFAVLNQDDAFGRSLAKSLKGGCSLWSYTMAPDQGDLVLTDLTLSATGFIAQIDGAAGPMTLRCPLLGRFNVANVMAAVGAALALDLNPGLIETLVAGLSAPPGRLERYGAHKGPQIVVDYAHTPDALASALGALRPHCQGKLWCVFGCGGDRDTSKRPLMGGIAEKLADQLVVTDDNPRSETPEHIAREILSGMQAPDKVTVIHDRRKAIAHALAGAAPRDLILIAGKGHEDTQERQGIRRPFSDRQVVLSLLNPSQKESQS